MLGPLEGTFKVAHNLICSGHKYAKDLVPRMLWVSLTLSTDPCLKVCGGYCSVKGAVKSLDTMALFYDLVGKQQSSK